MIYFLSDLHLGATYIADPRAHERRVVDFLRSIRHDAEHIYLLGDILDYWYEYKNVVPRGYVRFFGELAALSDAGIKITWLTGNHDIWLFDYLKNELGIEIIDSPFIEKVINGKRFVLAHGDRIGYRKLSFKFICRLFRNRLCQKLYASVHPRWTVSIAHKWSSSSRGGNGDSMSLEQFERFIIDNAKSLDTQADYIVMGHYHVLLNRKIENTNTSVIVLGDWIDNNSYGCYDGKNFILKKHTV